MTPAENEAVVRLTDTQLRESLRDALNGRFVGGDIAWAILDRWDALRAQAEAGADAMSKESARTLITDARRWQTAYTKARDELAEARHALREARRIAVNGDEHRIPDPLARLDAIESVARAALTGEGTE